MFHVKMEEDIEQLSNLDRTIRTARILHNNLSRKECPRTGENRTSQAQLAVMLPRQGGPAQLSYVRFKWRGAEWNKTAPAELE